MDIFDGQSAKPMLIGAEGDAFDSPDFIFELKLDGERCLAYLDRRETVLVNRRDRRVLPQFPELSTINRLVDNRCILDGELIVNTGSKSDFEIIKQRTVTRNAHRIQSLSREHPAIFVAVDILYRDHQPLVELPLLERQAILADMVEDSERLSKSRIVDEQGRRFFQLVVERGLEGIIAKRKDSLYRMGKRTREWVKIKNWLEDDFVICGYVPSDKASVCSLVIGQYNRRDRLVYKGRVTLGVNRDEFRLIDSLPKQRRHPFEVEPPEGSSGAIWVEPRLVCKVGFICWTVTLKLRQPQFKYLEIYTHPEDVREYLPPPGRDNFRICS